MKAVLRRNPQTKLQDTIYPRLEKMQILGLIGGIGSGKSTVAGLFAQWGAGVVDADTIGHRVLRLSKVKTAIEQRWGLGVFGPNGDIDRKAIADRVFSPTESELRELEFLTSLTHPIIKREIDAELQRLESAETPVAVLDAALLLETDWKTNVHYVVFVDAPRNVRLQRALRRGWTTAQFDAREATQLPLEFKKTKADWIVDNSGNFAQTLDEVQTVWQNLADAVGRAGQR